MFGLHLTNQTFMTEEEKRTLKAVAEHVMAVKVFHWFHDRTELSWLLDNLPNLKYLIVRTHVTSAIHPETWYKAFTGPIKNFIREASRRGVEVWVEPLNEPNHEREPFFRRHRDYGWWLKLLGQQWNLSAGLLLPALCWVDKYEPWAFWRENVEAAEYFQGVAFHRYWNVGGPEANFAPECDLGLPLFGTEVGNSARECGFSVTDEQMADEYGLFLAQSKKEPLVKAVCFYLVGGTEEWKRWYNITPEMAVGIVEKWKKTEVAEEVQPVPQRPEQPRGHYRSHFLLFPQGVEWKWVEAARDYITTFRVTWGQSLDDAMVVHGDLGHTITAVNPDEEALIYLGLGLEALGANYELDIIRAKTPEELKAILNERVREGRR